VRRAILPLITALALTAAASPASACDAELLQRLDPPFGEVISRVQMPSAVQRTVEIEKLTVEDMCDPDLTDDECIGQMTEKHAHLTPEGHRLVVHLEGPFSSVRAIFEIAKQRHEVVLPSYDRVASYMEAERLRDPDVTLISAEQVIDPSNRTAVMRVVEDRTGTVDIGAGVRMVVQLSMRAIDAMQAGGELDGIVVEAWTNQVDGTAIIDLRCAK